MQTSPQPNDSMNTSSFSIDSFDFGADFSLPSGLDELSIFGSQNPTANHSEAGSAPASHHPSPSGARSESTPSHQTNQQLGSSLRHVQDLSRYESSASPQSHGPVGQATSEASGSSSGLEPLRFSGYLQRPQLEQQLQQQHHAQMASVAPPQLSIADLQRLLLEKERSERIQSMQTAMLKQQLEQLQRMQENQIQQSKPSHAAAGSYPMQQSLSHPSASEVSHSQQQQFLSAFQNVLSNTGGSAPQSLQAPSASQGVVWQPSPVGGGPQTAGQVPSDPSALAQYGLMTPMGSGAFSNGCPPNQAAFMSPLNIPGGAQHTGPSFEAHRGHDQSGSFTPLESPAITPASVFSNVGTTIGVNELFSPLTSPALRPQPPSMAEIMLPPAVQTQVYQQHQRNVSQSISSPAFGPITQGSTTPTASPLALMGKAGPSGSGPRKNRSATAESKANKVRPSPLIKPTQGRRKKDSVSGSASNLHGNNGNGTSSNSSSRRQSVGDPTTTNSSTSNAHSINTYMPGSHVRNKSLEASPSEGTASTPSPIDLSTSTMPPPPPPPPKPLTPGSIMGIKSSNGNSMILPQIQPQPHSPGRSQAAKGGSGEKRPSTRPSQTIAGPRSSKGKVKATPAEAPSESHPVQLANIAPFPTQQGSGAAGSKAVSFSGKPPLSRTNSSSVGPNGSTPIQPGGLSAADREAWLSYKNAGGLESRRTSHKAAEQKRRDSLKFCFDELRGLLPAISLDDDAPGGSLLGPDGRPEDQTAEDFKMSDVGDPEQARITNKAISKVALLRHSNEYLIRLKKRLERRDSEIQRYREQIKELRQGLGLPPMEEVEQPPSQEGKVGITSSGHESGEGLKSEANECGDDMDSSEPLLTLQGLGATLNGKDSNDSSGDSNGNESSESTVTGHSNKPSRIQTEATSVPAGSDEGDSGPMMTDQAQTQAVVTNSMDMS
ncbi:hypothetical protein IE53DRAFT_384041 [Violaceomyces palustris]|uniref:Uncharacterized protein n=1 Tax=Violaceomyces palustris TaxID=1673888 RepID=A0ACD0P5P3_9BASI|nr:hypothetical protein IE53DRAFT_384041 [Violaceomyces palustris]